jgi:hypothetical protein
MTNFFQLILDNKEWIFSGIGIFFLTLFSKKIISSKKQKQSLSKHSSGIQAGGDVNINQKD